MLMHRWVLFSIHDTTRAIDNPLQALRHSQQDNRTKQTEIEVERRADAQP